MSVFDKIEQATPTEVPTEPVVPCLRCGQDFVWWSHPVQLCDACVDLELAKSNNETSTNDNL